MIYVNENTLYTQIWFVVNSKLSIIDLCANQHHHHHHQYYYLYYYCLLWNYFVYAGLVNFLTGNAVIQFIPDSINQHYRQQRQASCHHHHQLPLADEQVSAKKQSTHTHTHIHRQKISYYRGMYLIKWFCIHKQNKILDRKLRWLYIYELAYNAIAIRVYLYLWLVLSIPQRDVSRNSINNRHSNSFCSSNFIRLKIVQKKLYWLQLLRIIYTPDQLYSPTKDLLPAAVFMLYFYISTTFIIYMADADVET